jgi:lipoprotein-anchoring transpeptidase ErfK/SrfK
MRRRWMLLLMVPVLVGTVLGVGVGVAARKPPAPPPAVAPGPTPSTAAAPTPEPDVVLQPAPPPDPLGQLPEVQRPAPSADPTDEPAPERPVYDVAAVQRQLTDLRYYAGVVDGKEGPGMRAAVMAFQKVNGLGADGTVGPLTLAALANPVTPALRSGPANRIEVDLDKQVLYFVAGGQLQRIMPVSSGSGQTYGTKGGGTARSLTPVGTFRIERRIKGERNAELGTLYDPLYFYKGWAIHGSNSVPAYPASHGCVRVTRADGVWLFERAPVGTTVVLYGGQHTFTAGSSAPGTDTPAGDTGTQPPPAPPPAPPPPAPPPAQKTSPPPPPAAPAPQPTQPPPTGQPPAPPPPPVPTEQPAPPPEPPPTPAPAPPPTEQPQP